MERGSSRIISRRIYFMKKWIWDLSYTLDNDESKYMLLLMMMMVMTMTTCHLRRRFHIYFSSSTYRICSRNLRPRVFCAP